MKMTPSTVCCFPYFVFGVPFHSYVNQVVSSLNIWEQRQNLIIVIMDDNERKVYSICFLSIFGISMLEIVVTNLTHLTVEELQTVTSSVNRFLSSKLIIIL